MGREYGEHGPFKGHFETVALTGRFPASFFATVVAMKSPQVSHAQRLASNPSSSASAFQGDDHGQYNSTLKPAGMERRARGNPSAQGEWGEEECGSHRDNVPRGHESIVEDEPDYGGFLRGRMASFGEDQLVVVYCREETLATAGEKLDQFFAGISKLPVPVQDDALVISDNGDIYGTVSDLYQRAASCR